MKFNLNILIGIDTMNTMNTMNTTTHTTDKPLSYGFTDFNSNSWPDASVDTYNRFNEQVNKRLRLGYASLARSSLAYKELDFYMTQRHKTFNLLCELAASNEA